MSFLDNNTSSVILQMATEDEQEEATTDAADGSVASAVDMFTNLVDSGAIDVGVGSQASTVGKVGSTTEDIVIIGTNPASTVAAAAAAASTGTNDIQVLDPIVDLSGTPGDASQVTTWDTGDGFVSNTERAAAFQEVFEEQENQRIENCIDKSGNYHKWVGGENCPEFPAGTPVIDIDPHGNLRFAAAQQEAYHAGDQDYFDEQRRQQEAEAATRAEDGFNATPGESESDDRLVTLGTFIGDSEESGILLQTDFEDEQSTAMPTVDLDVVEQVINTAGPVTDDSTTGGPTITVVDSMSSSDSTEGLTNEPVVDSEIIGQIETVIGNGFNPMQVDVHTEQQQDVSGFGATGGGGTPSPGDEYIAGDEGGVSFNFEMDDRIYRSAEYSSDCDEPPLSPASRASDAASAPPIIIPIQTPVVDEFLFDQLSSPDEYSGPQSIVGWFSPFQKRNIMIPQQYYYTDNLSGRPYLMRKKEEQDQQEYNMGGLHAPPTHKDNLRYALGLTWDHLSIKLSGMPKIVEAQAVDTFMRGMDAGIDADEAKQRRGIFISVHDDGSDRRSNQDGHTWETTVELMTTYDKLRKMIDFNPEMWQGVDFDFYLYLDDLTKVNTLFAGMPGTNLSDTIFLKHHYDHTFESPAGFNHETLPSFAETAASDLVSIYTRVRSEDSFFAPSQTKTEREKKSIYRQFCKDFGTGTLRYPLVAVDVPEDEPTEIVGWDFRPLTGEEYQQNFLRQADCGKDMVQKFPLSAIRSMVDINQNIFSPLGSDFEAENTGQPGTIPFATWLDKNMNVCNVINFRMNHESAFSSLLAEANLEVLLFEMIDNLSPSNTSYYTQILDSSLNDLNPGTDYDDPRITAANKDKVAINLRPNEFKAPISMLQKMIKGEPYANRPAYRFEIDNYSYPLAYDDALTNDNTAGWEENPYRQHLWQYFGAGLDNPRNPVPGEFNILADAASFKEKYFRSYELSYADVHRTAEFMMKGNECYSEVIAYRIIKSDADSGEVIQEFLFSNAHLNNPELNFIDSQVISGKKYRYQIFTLNLVVGSRYGYNLQGSSFRFDRNPTDPAETAQGYFQTDFRPFFPGNVTITSEEIESLEGFQKASAIYVKMPIQVKPDIRIIEAPYYEQIIETASENLPPLYPDIQIWKSPRETVQNTSPTMFVPIPRFGQVCEKIITFSPADEATAAVMIARHRNSTAPSIVGQEDKIDFRSDSPPTHYEMFYCLDEPEGYNSFYGKESFRVSAEENAFFDIDTPLNRKIYLIFRAVDESGFSNPSPIFEFTKHNNGDGSYVTFEVYERDLLDDYMPIQNERLISISPSTDQAIINFHSDPALDLTPEQRSSIASGLLETVPENFNDVILGVIPPDTHGTAEFAGLIWDRKFKFRFTSISSGNSFDINTTFKYNKISLDVPSPEVSEEECSEGTGVSERESRRRQNEENSNSRLNNPRAQGEDYTSIYEDGTDNDDLGVFVPFIEEDEETNGTDIIIPAQTDTDLPPLPGTDQTLDPPPESFQDWMDSDDDEEAVVFVQGTQQGVFSLSPSGGESDADGDGIPDSEDDSSEVTWHGTPQFVIIDTDDDD